MWLKVPPWLFWQNSREQNSVKHGSRGIKSVVCLAYLPFMQMTHVKFYFNSIGIVAVVWSTNLFKYMRTNQWPKDEQLTADQQSNSCYSSPTLLEYYKWMICVVVAATEESRTTTTDKYDCPGNEGQKDRNCRWVTVVCIQGCIRYAGHYRGTLVAYTTYFEVIGRRRGLVVAFSIQYMAPIVNQLQDKYNMSHMGCTCMSASSDDMAALLSIGKNNVHDHKS